MTDMDMDMDYASPSQAEMDWIETPSYWKGWQTDALSRGDTGRPHSINVVVDTNILVQNLAEFDTLVQSEWYFQFCIPFTVLSELDSLKHKKKSDGGQQVVQKAYKAIRYLEHVFMEGKKTFLGQSLQQFKEAISKFGIKGIRQNNDDLILQCSLQKAAMDVGIPLILLTNDKNLKLKGKACGIQAASIHELLTNVEQVVSAAKPIEANHLDQEKAVSDAPKKLHSSIKLTQKDDFPLSDYMDKILDVLLKSFTTFIQDKFHENFGNDWDSMVSIKPPWTFNDCLKLLKQHWFSLDLKEGVQDKLDLLVHVYPRYQKNGRVPFRTFLMFVQESLDICQILFKDVKLEVYLNEMHQIRDSIYDEVNGANEYSMDTN